MHASPAGCQPQPTQLTEDLGLQSCDFCADLNGNDFHTQTHTSSHFETFLFYIFVRWRQAAELPSATCLHWPRVKQRASSQEPGT